jgi:colanic acid biosynthesis glycosyl transferase WcaI
MNKKFFLISQVFYPDEVSTAGLFTNLCEKLAERGVGVSVWCAQPSYNTRKKQQKKCFYKGINIRYLASTRLKKDSHFGRLMNYFTFSVSLVFRFIFSKKNKQVFTSTNPPFLGFLVAFLCSIKKTEFIYIIQDVYPDGLIKLNKLQSNGFLTRIWRWSNKYTLNRAHKIVVIGRDMKNWLADYGANVLQKVTYIPIWQDGDLIKPLDITINSFVKQNNLSNQFIVQYSGNMGLWNDMVSFGKAINSIKEADIVFTFIGEGIRKKELMDILTENSNTRFFPFQPKENLNITLTACHVALVSLNRGLEGIAVPSKIMGILAAGIPTIAMVPKQSEIAMIIEGTKCGIVIEPGDTRKLTENIYLLKNNVPLRVEMGKNARKAFLENFDIKIIAERYEQLIH